MVFGVLFRMLEAKKRTIHPAKATIMNPFSAPKQYLNKLEITIKGKSNFLEVFLKSLNK